MNKDYLPGMGKTAWQNNKPFLVFLLSLLIILSVLKIIFYNYNYAFIFGADGGSNTGKDKLTMIKWALGNDLAILLLVNTPLLVLLQLARIAGSGFSKYFVIPFFTLLNSIVIFLNLADIFYFPFHFQRANADLLFVLDHPFQQLFHQHFIIVLGFLILTALVLFGVWKIVHAFFKAFSSGKRCRLTTVILVLSLCIIPFAKNSLSKLLLPAYPLVEVNSKQLLVVQNSFHTFTYSLFRSGQDVPLRHYMPVAECDSIFPVRKTLALNKNDSSHKNIMLFIMESVPYDFFDTGSPYKVAMPFFDSILQKSSFFTNAFSYSHQSNKGITAILAGVPTLSDIPLYHSSFINMPLTHIGTALKTNHYHSFFCIGDDYDNFGFAKCVNWLGIEKYYCREDIPGSAQLPTHTMGLQDEYVLDFVRNRINQTPAPFFAINYNISTHYPYDLPAGYIKSLPKPNTKPMQSMSYYDYSLHRFFNAAKQEPWFRNTVFIFCSDHWLVPDDENVKFNAVSGYHIPVIIYDPSTNEKKTDDHPVSQFDILGTLLAISGYKDPVISYGRNLLDSTKTGNTVFMRVNSSLYQAADSAFILGFNTSNERAEFLYNYRLDKPLQKNLLTDPASLPELNKLTLLLKAFLQKASMQYNGSDFR